MEDHEVIAWIQKQPAGLATFSRVARIEGLLAMRLTVVALHCLLYSAAARYRHSPQHRRRLLELKTLKSWRLRTGTAATPEISSPLHTSAAMPDTQARTSRKLP